MEHISINQIELSGGIKVPDIPPSLSGNSLSRLYNWSRY